MLVSITVHYRVTIWILSRVYKNAVNSGLTSDKQLVFGQMFD